MKLSGKALLLTLGLAVGACLAAGYFWLAHSWESKMTTGTVASLQKLFNTAQVDNIQADFFRTSLTLDNIRFTTERDDGSLTIEAKNIHIAGLPRFAFSPDAACTLASSVQLQDLTMTFQPPEGIRTVITYPYVDLKDIKKKKSPPFAQVKDGDWLARVLWLSKYGSIGHVQGTSYTQTLFFGEQKLSTTSIAESSLENFSFFHSGKVTYKNILFVQGPSDATPDAPNAMSIDFLGVDAYFVPEQLIEQCLVKDCTEQTIRQILTDEPLKITNFCKKGFTLKGLLGLSQPITMDSLNFSLTIGGEDGKMQFDLANLTAPHMLFMMALGNMDIDIESRQSITISSRLHADWADVKDTHQIRIDSGAIDASHLGSLTGTTSFFVPYNPQSNEPEFDESSLGSTSFSITDKGILDIFARYYGLSLGFSPQSVPQAELRAALAHTLTQAEPSATDANHLAALGQFIRNSGTLEVSIKGEADAPIPLNSFDLLSSPEVTFRHNPPPSEQGEAQPDGNQ